VLFHIYVFVIFSLTSIYFLSVWSCVLACKYEESDNIENLSTLQPCCVLIVESWLRYRGSLKEGKGVFGMKFDPRSLSLPFI
jgi:hypothetical protein